MAMSPRAGCRRSGFRREAASAASHVTGATVLPVHLAGTRDLYAPWKRWPAVTVTIGWPLTVERDC